MAFKSMISVAYIDFVFFYKIVIVTLASWLPLHILKKFKSYKYPNDYEKIMITYKK